MGAMTDGQTKRDKDAIYGLVLGARLTKLCLFDKKWIISSFLILFLF